MYIIFFILDAKLQNNAELEKHFWRNRITHVRELIFYKSEGVKIAI